jgi:SsrA-binding protein
MKIINRKFNRDYQEIERFEAGISLTGAEVKSIRSGRMKLEDSFVRIIGSEVYLVNAEIPIYEYARPQGYDLRRSRKLLLHRKEILRLKGKISSHSGLTLAPISCYNKHGLVKLEIALAKGRKSVDKKNLEKRREIERREEREAKEYLKS